MADGNDSNGLLLVRQLVDDAVGADSQGAQSSQASSKRMPGFRLLLQKSEGFGYRFGYTPIQVEDLAPSRAGQDDLHHSGASSVLEVPAKV